MSKKERNGQRKMRSIGSKSQEPDLGYYIIVTDTEETEKNYINGLRDSIPKDLQRRLTIKVSETKSDKLVEEAMDLVALQPQYAEPWIVLDRDQLKTFDSIIKKANDVGINVAWSNPCIEIWFSAYFGTMPTAQESVKCCEFFGKIFKSNTQQKYLKNDKHIYDKLNSSGDEKNAIKLAEQKLKEQFEMHNNKYSKMCPATTMHKLVEEIKDKIGKN